MKQFNLSDMKEGWFVGDFTPTAYKTRGAEVAFKHHHKDANWPKHFQKEATEINLVTKGVIKIGEDVFVRGDIFVVEPLEAIKPEFITDVEVICVKIPSLPGDKVTVK